MVTICVFRKDDGKAVKDAKVRILFGWADYVDGVTNKDGEVDLNFKPGEGRIEIDGKEVYKGEISGRKTVYK